MGAFQQAQPRVGCFGFNTFGSLLSKSFQVSSWARGTNINPPPGVVVEMNMDSLSSFEPAKAVRMLKGPIWGRAFGVPSRMGGISWGEKPARVSGGRLTLSDSGRTEAYWSPLEGGGGFSPHQKQIRAVLSHEGAGRGGAGPRWRGEGTQGAS